MVWYGMTTQREMHRINKLLRIILKEKNITKVDLVMKSGMSISYYERLRPFLARIYEERIQYDKTTGTWSVTEEEKSYAIEEKKEISTNLSELCPEIPNIELN